MWFATLEIEDAVEHIALWDTVWHERSLLFCTLCGSLRSSTQTHPCVICFMFSDVCETMSLSDDVIECANNRATNNITVLYQKLYQLLVGIRSLSHTHTLSWHCPIFSRHIFQSRSDSSTHNHLVCECVSSESSHGTLSPRACWERTNDPQVIGRG